MKKHETGSKTKKDPDSRINKSLRKWNCKCSSAQMFEEKIADATEEMMHRISSRARDAGTAANIVGWTAPTAIGAIAGGVTAPRKKTLLGALRGAGLGAATHAGASLGARVGNAAGGAANGITGGAIGGLGGGLGAALLANYLLPSISEEEKQSMNTQNNLYAFGAKLAADPRATDETGGAYSPLGRQDLLNRIDGIAAMVNGPARREGPLYGSSGGAQDYGMDYSRTDNRWVSDTERNHANYLDKLQHNVAAYENRLEGLKNNSNSAAQFGTAASMGLNAAGNAIGAPVLAGAANMGLTGSRVADLYARNNAVKTTQQNLNTAKQNLQQFKQPWEGQQKLSPALAPKPVTPAVKAGEALAFGAKLAQSMCQPCDMPNGPANKKHTTGASPAVLEADEKSEELGRPETEETEHSEQSIDIPGKAAAFGAKLAANYGGLWQNPNQFAGANSDLQLVNPATGFSQDSQMTFPYEGPTPFSVAKSVLDFVNKQRLAAGTAIGDAVGTAMSAPGGAWTGPASPKPAAPKPVAAPTNLYDALVSVAKSDVTGKDLPAAISQVSPPAISQVSPPERAAPGMLSQILGSPYTPYVAGGLGATGLAALTYYLMNQKPKKKREDEKE